MVVMSVVCAATAVVPGRGAAAPSVPFDPAFGSATGHPGIVEVGSNVIAVTADDGVLAVPLGAASVTKLRADGSVVSVLIDMTVVHDTEAAPGYYFVQVRDITENEDPESARERTLQLKYRFTIKSWTFFK